VSCTRIFDLRRHKSEQHGIEDVICLLCGEHYEIGTLEEHLCTSRLGNMNMPEDVVQQAPRALEPIETAGISELQASGEDRRLDPRAEATPASTGPLPTFTNIPCGHCGKPFENNDNELSSHLDAHLAELILGRHTCEICDFSFVRKKDLTFHHDNAARANTCGFLNHEVPCGGHHAPTCPERADFCYRVGLSEQLQLQLFLLSIRSLHSASRNIPLQRPGDL